MVLSKRLRQAWAASVVMAFSQSCIVSAANRSEYGKTPDDGPEQSAIHGQFTYVEQETSAFNAPYRGANSLSPRAARETTDATLYLGARLWAGSQLWINPEIDQGFGLDNTVGVAGFPSGEAYKVGRNQPYFRLQRAFLRQEYGLGGSAQSIESSLNQLGGSRMSDRLVLTAGKFAATDVFDANQYAHDPRGDFLNWAAIDAGTFDYAADAWGYSVGAAVEWFQGRWTVRAGFFDLSTVPNSAHLDPGFHEFQTILELERRHEIIGRPGKLLITLFDSHGRMGLLADAIRLSQTTGGPVDIKAVRAYRDRPGVDLNLEQQLTANLGLFTRAGTAAGNVEAYEFTDIDRTLAAGLSLKGARWKRGDDTIGIAAIVNEISATRQRYLDAGGLGILVGDGRLPHPGREQVVEGYYNLLVIRQVQVTLDYQWVTNPAYNRDRGPVSVFAVRLHAQL